MIWFIALSIVVTGISWMVTIRCREHRPVALLLTVGLLGDLARLALSIHVMVPGHQRFDPAPFTGWYRVACDVDNALFLSWHASIASLAMVVFLRRNPCSAFVGWALVIAAFAIGYPVTRGDVLRRCYLAIEMVTSAVFIGCYVLWWWKREKPTVQNVCALFIGSIQLATLLGPYSHNLFKSWGLAQVMYATLYVTLGVLQGGFLWVSSRFK